jgi:hypothetical protein
MPDKQNSMSASVLYMSMSLDGFVAGQTKDPAMRSATVGTVCMRGSRPVPTLTTRGAPPVWPEFDGVVANALVDGGAFRRVVTTSCPVAAGMVAGGAVSVGGRGSSWWCRCRARCRWLVGGGRGG